MIFSGMKALDASGVPGSSLDCQHALQSLEGSSINSCTERWAKANLSMSLLVRCIWRVVSWFFCVRDLLKEYRSFKGKAEKHLLANRLVDRADHCNVLIPALDLFKILDIRDIVGIPDAGTVYSR